MWEHHLGSRKNRPPQRPVLDDSATLVYCQCDHRGSAYHGCARRTFNGHVISSRGRSAASATAAPTTSSATPTATGQEHKAGEHDAEQEHAHNPLSTRKTGGESSAHQRQSRHDQHPVKHAGV